MDETTKKNLSPKSAQQALRESKTTECANPGNPLFSCMAKVEVVKDEMKRNQCFQTHHPLYQTSAGTYGELPPSAQTAPSTFHGKSQRFSQHLGKCGMYRNHSLNTALDKSKVYDFPQM
ncbi:piercer of microtubule wall 2 protein-like [Ciona intestinalis]